MLDDADIPTLQEYLGYCLIPSTKGQKMMLIVGKGGEGKSRIGLVLKRLMGDAASNGSVQKVENNRFARADLERRLLMIDDDMDMNALPKTNYIKTMHNAGYTDVERGERGSTEEHLTVTQFKVQREQERLDSLTAQVDQKAQSLAKTSQTLSKKEKELAAVQKKTTLTKEALIHARDLDYIGKRTFLGNYSLTEEEFSKLKKQADHGYMMDVENRRLKEELSTAKKEAVRWSNKYHDLWYDVKPYLDALHRAPELVCGFLEKILAPKQERTMNVQQQNRKRGQDIEL